MWGYQVGQLIPGGSPPKANPMPGQSPMPAGGMTPPFFQNPLPPQAAPASPMLMTAAIVAAFAGGGALIGWAVLHSQKAAIIGGGIGLAVGALSQASETWKMSS